MLQGWEVKSIRDGRVQLTEAYITLHQGEAYLASANITPLTSASLPIQYAEAFCVIATMAP